MRRRVGQVVIVVVVLLATFVGGVVAADEELTLAGLAEQLTALTTRVATVEALWTGPGATMLDDGGCQIGTDGSIQNETFLKYKDTWGEWPAIDQMRVFSVSYQESGDIHIVYSFSFTDQRVMEIWNGCDFVRSSDWWTVDWQGNKITE